MLNVAGQRIVIRNGFWSSASTPRVKYAIILFTVCLAYFGAYANRTLLDPDTYWHLVVGRNIWWTGDFPHVDQFSHTLAGAPWIGKEWLAQLIFYGAYASGGWSAVALLAIVIALLSYLVVFSWLMARVDPIVAVTMVVVNISLTTGSLLARPQIFYYLLLSLCSCGLVGAVEKKRIPWWLIPLVALWANIHPSFPIALVLAALFGFEAFVSAQREQRLKTLVSWTIVILGGTAAAGATPYGYEPLLISFKIFGGNATNYIDEWRAAGLNFPSIYGAAFLAGSLALVAASRVSRARLLPLVVCGGLMIRHMRFMSLFGIVASTALASPVAMRFPRFAARQGRVPNDAERKWTSLALATTGAAAIVVLACAPRPHPAEDITPSAALEAAEKYGVSGPAFNDYNFGGYLIFKGVKTFIDGRAELYLDDLLPTLYKAEQSSNDKEFFSLLDKCHVTWALASPQFGAVAKLSRSMQWKRIYQDKVADVFVRISK